MTAGPSSIHRPVLDFETHFIAAVPVWNYRSKTNPAEGRIGNNLSSVT